MRVATRRVPIRLGGAMLLALALTGAGRPVPQATSATWVTLGTSGGPVSNPARAQPANLLQWRDRNWLVDAGDGAAQQLAKAGVPLHRLDAVFLSHVHLDHTGGLAAIIGLRYQLQVRGKLQIYGPPGTRAIVAGIVASLKPFADAGYGFGDPVTLLPADTVDVHELAAGETLQVGDARVRVAQNSHYSFAPGSAEDAASKSYSYRFDLPGRSIVYTGDTGPSAAVEALGAGADLLVAELIDLDSVTAQMRATRPDMRPEQFADMRRHLSQHHLTPDQIGAMAQAMRVRKVVATHLAVGRIGPRDLARYVVTIKRTFAGDAAVARDLERF
ncbi:MBL fold metallo-hydrolase [Sphingomonas sp. SUN039]|uniref:MBL fold metallo-hydrolase n=1 Tax=Sphingomonas sp. SUN039 TaxID=2937787 RepID=UPI002164C4A2|nr:MBL fold metallo-hydrolase [Sphingomonas sp. SUN039]UVO54351.1 MBL fold metallo-hydrolase [Sphingomonas sp. SUN039]